MPHSPTGDPVVLAFGDSLTAGYGLPSDQSFAAQLQAALRRTRPAARVINAGVSGDTTASALARLPRVLSGLSARPDLAIVELGANDLLRGVEPARMRQNLDAILHGLRDVGIPPLVAGMRAPFFLGPFAATFDAVFPAVAAAHGAPIYPFFLDGVIGDPSLVLADGLHPNARAIGIVVDRILPTVTTALDTLARAA
ncbi:arylesterase [Sphingomonas rubra]|uniref:Acyl-CoA thioesterase-1 n=1 Tax=Sphingomonas rubra TaxID=634430 RepID=A0A1I5TSZ2_9SPHN|nr:arylesterase [Sphingomonas rubra]SFP86031.1 acyl-CoA thioesterase-1 [Sphingomonas rubra]